MVVFRFFLMVENNNVSEEIVCFEWKRWVNRLNRKIRDYAKKHGVTMGTTLTMLLVYQSNYYIYHVGDSGLYRITKSMQKLTEEHTVVAREIRMGTITKECAATDPRRNILLQCVGVSEVLEPQFSADTLVEDTTFILYSDGFIHMIEEAELYQYLRPEIVTDNEQISRRCQELTQMVMDRGERDNITVIVITFKGITDSG